MLKILAAAFLTTVGLFSSAPAADAKPIARSGARPVTLAEGGYVLPPISFSKFCLDYPLECAGGAVRVHISPDRMATLEAVNRRVNGSIAPTPDTSRFRFWALNVSHGDCNNFAIQKRHELIQRGWPAGALALSVVKTPWGEGHLVVTVRTDVGDYVLDNLRAEVVDWRRAGYRWVMRQSERNPQFWVSLNGGRPAVEDPADTTLTASAPDVEAPAFEAALPGPARTLDPVANEASEPMAPRRSGRGMSVGALEDSPAESLLADKIPLNLGAAADPLTMFALPSQGGEGAEFNYGGLSIDFEAGALSLRGAFDETPEA